MTDTSPDSTPSEPPPGTTGTGVSDAQNSADEGVGCLPGILAAAALMGIVGFVFCGFMTWLIFQKQDQLALRAMQGNFIPAVEQSLLEPGEKTRTVELLGEFAEDLERGKYEGWQASGVMQRLARLPVLQWGQIRVVEQFVDANPDDFEPDASPQFDRLRKGVENDNVTTIDFSHILAPVLKTDVSQLEADLVEELEIEAVRDVVQRARLVADRAKVASMPKSDVTIDILVRRQIDAGITEGSF